MLVKGIPGLENSDRNPFCPYSTQQTHPPHTDWFHWCMHYRSQTSEIFFSLPLWCINNAVSSLNLLKIYLEIYYFWNNIIYFFVYFCHYVFFLYQVKWTLLSTFVLKVFSNFWAQNCCWIRCSINSRLFYDQILHCNSPYQYQGIGMDLLTLYK